MLICRGERVLRSPTNAEIAECLGFNDSIAVDHTHDVIPAPPSAYSASTRWTKEIELAFHSAIWLGLGIDNAGTVVVFALDATALALLGPGAHSVDSYRFGRRLVVLPPQ